jgi:hypothetical protein
MSRNPFLNALAAAVYVAAVAWLLYYAPRLAGPVDNVLAPIALLSLFVLSAAVRGLVFLDQPVVLYVEGDKAGAARLFLRTVAAFAGITAVLLVAAFWFGGGGAGSASLSP